MNKSFIKKIILILIIMVFMLLVFTIKSNAASLSISTSKKTVEPGESFTVTVTLSNGAGSVTSNGQTQWLDNSSFSYTKTAGSSGSISLSASGTVADYTTEEDQNVSASATVSVIEPTTSEPSGNSGSTSKPVVVEKPKEVEKSRINTLKELSIDGIELFPEFDIDVKEYSIKIPYEMTSINITVTPTDSKASVKIEGNEELEVGENVVTIIVTAENGNKNEYKINVTRAREALYLKTIVVKYTNQEGETVELPLNPAFSIDVLEYTVDDIEYWVENLIVEAEANLPDAAIEIKGIDNLQVGENVITIVARIQNQEEVAEGEEPEEEIIIYTIKVNKLTEPTWIEKISNKARLIFGGVMDWYSNNQHGVIVYSLVACVIALIGLSAYIVVDYKKYKTLIEKLTKLDQINTAELETETNIGKIEAETTADLKNEKLEIKENIDSNVEEDVNAIDEEQVNKEESIKEEKNIKQKRGKHF